MSRFVQVINVVTTICDADNCTEPSRLIGANEDHYHHVRLNVDIHEACVRTSRVKGENVQNHCMQRKSNQRVE